MLVFISEDFPVGLKQNLWEDDNLLTRGKLPIPKCVLCSEVLLKLSEKEDNYYEENMSRLLSDTDSHTIIGGRR